MKYTVIWKCKTSELVSEVNDMIAEGWRPLGGISSDRHALFQAMIKEEPKP